MGTDMYAFAERRVDGQWRNVKMRPRPFDVRNYAAYGYLAGVRNYAAVPIHGNPRGLPLDLRPSLRKLLSCDDFHSQSWLSIDELLAIDPDELVENRRGSIMMPSGAIFRAHTLPAGEGRIETMYEFLNRVFFEDIGRCVAAGVERIVFAFAD